MRTRNPSTNRPARKTVGQVSPTRAGSPGIRLIDAARGVDIIAKTVYFTGAVVTDPDDDDDGAFVDIVGGTGSGGSGSGVGSYSGTPVPMLNNSGGALAAGTVVIVDSTADDAVTTTTTAADTHIAGVTQAAIAAADIGPVLFNGFTGGLITTGTITRGYYLETSTVAGAAQAVVARGSGTFGVVTSAADLSDFARSKTLTLSSGSVTSFTITIPTAPVNRVLFLALYRDPLVVTTPTITGWTRIGATSGFYYYYRVTTGTDPCVATWTTASVAVAIVLLLDATVNVTSIVETQAFEATTAAATLAGMSSAANRYAVAAVQGEEYTVAPSGWTLLGAGTNTGDGIVADQNLAHGTVTAAAAGTGAVAPVDPAKSNDGNDATFTQFASGGSGGTLPERWIVADLGAAYSVTGYTTLSSESLGQGIYTGLSTGTSQPGQYFRFKYSTDNVTFTEIASTRQSTDGNNPHLEVFTFDSGAISARYWMAYAAGKDSGNIWGGVNLYTWAITGSPSASAIGSLVGKYIATDAAVTSPFTGATDALDALFAINLTQAALPSGLLYGPDLNHAGTPITAPLILEDGTIAILEDGSAAMGETTYS